MFNDWCDDDDKDDNTRVKLGEYDFYKDGETEDKTYEVESIKVHENWDPRTYENDIALLK